MPVTVSHPNRPRFKARLFTIETLKTSAWYGSIVAMAWTIAVPVFVRLTSNRVHTDIMDHARLARSIVISGHGLSYSFWYPLVFLFSRGATSLELMRLASIGLLAVFVALKAVLVFWLAAKFIPSRWLSAAITFASLVITPLIDPNRPQSIYLGQISATVWHNSTTILLEPFALLAFISALHLLQDLRVRSAILFSVFLCVATLAKPNFTLAFMPVAATVILVCLTRRHRKLWAAMALMAISLLPPLLTLTYQYVVTYVGSSVITSKVVFAPFEVWRVLSPNIPLSLVLSLIGPVLLFASLSRTQRKSLPVILSGTTTLVAILQLIVFGERTANGAIAASGNWFWGSYASIFILFVVLIIEYCKPRRVAGISVSSSLTRTVAGLALAAHLASGIYYFLNIGMPGYADY